MHASRRAWWATAAATAGSAGAAYCGASYYSGTLSYAPLRSSEWVAARMAASDSVNAVGHDANYVRIDDQLLPEPLTSRARGGGLSTAMLGFRDQRDPLHTYTFVHCGPFTCGFPFLVHGGLLGTLLYQSVHLAQQVPADKHLGGSLSIKYRRPTFVDQILCIETRGEDGLVKTSISSERSGHRLVEGVYRPPA